MTMKINVTKNGLALGYRSGLEESIADMLDSKGIAYGFETVKLDYIKPQTKHKYS